jgi:hypothetical protein
MTAKALVHNINEQGDSINAMILYLSEPRFVEPPAAQRLMQGLVYRQ